MHNLKVFLLNKKQSVRIFIQQVFCIFYIFEIFLTKNNSKNNIISDWILGREKINCLVHSCTPGLPPNPWEWKLYQFDWRLQPTENIKIGEHHKIKKIDVHACAQSWANIGKRVREVPNVIKTVLACPCNLHPHPAQFRIHESYFQNITYKGKCLFWKWQTSLRSFLTAPMSPFFIASLIPWKRHS